MRYTRIEWTAAQDATIRRLRGDGKSWDAIADELGVNRHTAIERGKVIGVTAIPIKAAEAEPVERDVRNGAPLEALPAGHPFTWGLLTQGTCLEGSEYVHASMFRQFAVRGNEFVAHANAITREVPAAPR
jgi:hypothetical protein